MCDKCKEIDATVERYRRLRGSVDDQQMHKATERLIADLEAQKVALHPEIASLATHRDF